MAVTVTFADGTTVQCAKSAYSGTMEHQNQRRKYLEMYFEPEVISLSELKRIYTDTAMTSDITTRITYIVEEKSIDENGSEVIKPVEKTAECVHLNMTMPVSLGYSMQADGKELISMRMAQMSDIEIIQAKQAEEIELTQAALIEALEMIGGE